MQDNDPIDTGNVRANSPITDIDLLQWDLCFTIGCFGNLASATPERT
jgi:hypothetical protein